MSTSPLLQILLMSQSQNNKYLTVNDICLALEAATNGVVQIAMADANQTPSAATFFANSVFQCQGALTADRQLILPVGARSGITVHNLTTGGHNIVVTTGTGATVAVPPAEDIVTGSLGTIFGVTGAQDVYVDPQGNVWARA